MNFKINRKHIVDIKNVRKIRIVRKEVWVYMKSGYPPIFKADCSLQTLKLRLLNIGENPNQFDKE